MTTSINKKLIASWCLYDWANSAYYTIVTTFVFAAYFAKMIAPNPIVATKQWGYANAITGMLVVLFSPFIGTRADQTGKMKSNFIFLNIMVMLASALLWYATPTPNSTFLLLFLIMIGSTSAELAMVVYNAMLVRISPNVYMGRISGWGWGSGYIGGLTSLVICLVFFINQIFPGLESKTAEQIRICGPFVAVWIGIFSLPLFFYFKDSSKGKTPSPSIKSTLHTLWQNLKELYQHKMIFYFLVARTFYNDGISALFLFTGIYAESVFKMNFQEILMFGIAMNIGAGFGAFSFAWIDDWIGSKKTIIISLLSMSIFLTILLFVENKMWFWVNALAISIFVGPAQAASRSLMARLVDPKNSNMLFGLYALSGRITSYLAPWLVSFLTGFFASQRVGMSGIVVFFVVGLVGLIFVKVRTDTRLGGSQEAQQPL